MQGKAYELTDKAYTLSAKELRENYVLACQSMPRSNVVLELPGDLDALERMPVVERAGAIVALRGAPVAVELLCSSIVLLPSPKRRRIFFLLTLDAFDLSK